MTERVLFVLRNGVLAAAYLWCLACAASATQSQSQVVVVRRHLSQTEVTDVMTDHGKIVYVRKAVPTLLGVPPFDMPEKYELNITRSGSAEAAFRAALVAMGCGDAWSRRRLADKDAYGPLGKWRTFFNQKCDRSEIVSGNKLIFEGIGLRQFSITFTRAIR